MKLNDEDDTKFKEEVEVVRLGPYLEGKTRCIKIRLKSQQATEEILERTSKLREVEDCKNIYIKNRNEEEWKKNKEMCEEAK